MDIEKHEKSHALGDSSPLSVGEGEIDRQNSVTILGYKPELKVNRSLFTLLFQTLAIAAIPFGEGSPIISAIYGGGQLSIFLGWIVVCILGECVALSLSELASRYPTSAGPYYWTFQIARKHKTVLSFITGWIWLVGNWTITLSVNFGLASLIAATAAMYHPLFVASPWQLLLIFYAICLLTFVICTFGNRFLPMVDTICAAWTGLSILIILISLSVEAKAGRHPASYTLGHYDTSYSGWGGFTFMIGLLPAAYTFSAIGMISSMAEEVADPAVKVPSAISLCIPVGGTAGLFVSYSLAMVYYSSELPPRCNSPSSVCFHFRCILTGTTVHHPNLRHSSAARRRPFGTTSSSSTVHLPRRHGDARRRPWPNVPRASDHNVLQY